VGIQLKVIKAIGKGKLGEVFPKLRRRQDNMSSKEENISVASKSVCGCKRRRPPSFTKQSIKV
jgi:hypothetical protein